MKKSVLTTLAITLLFSLQAQVQIRPLPQRGYEQRIKNFIDNVRVVDTHEHLEA